MIRYDYLLHEEQTLLETEALINGNRILYKEGKDARQCVTFGDHEILLQRYADVSSETILLPEKIGTSTIKSSYGDMVLRTRLMRYEKTPDAWMVEYQVLSGEEVVLYQRLTWILKTPNPLN